MIQNENQRKTDARSDLPGGIIAMESDPRKVEAAMNRSAPFRHFGLRVRLNPELTADGKSRSEFAGDDVAPVILDLPEILPHHRGGTTISSVNGGVIAMICDVAVGLTIVGTGLPIRTGSGVGRLSIRMRRPVEGDALRATGFIDRIRRNLIYARVEIRDTQGVLCVDATGTIYRSRDGALPIP